MNNFVENLNFSPPHTGYSQSPNSKIDENCQTKFGLQKLKFLEVLSTITFFP
jgi:hypothetical protein